MARNRTSAAVAGSIRPSPAEEATRLEREFEAEKLRWYAQSADEMVLKEVAERTMPIMTAFLAGELPPEMAAVVTNFLRTEPLMREAYAGLLAAWQAPNAERLVSDAEVNAAWERFKVMRDARFGPNGGLQSAGARGPDDTPA